MWFSDYFNWWYQNGENQEGKGNNIGEKVIIVDQNELEKKINGLSHVETELKDTLKDTLKTDQEKSEFHRVFESRKKRQEKIGEKLMVLDDWSVKYLNSQ